MTANDIRHLYQRTGVETATPHRLVAMLYEGGIRRCHEGAAAITAANLEEASTALLKAQAIVAELMAGLDVEAGGEIAQQLFEHYSYMHRRLVHANIKRDADAASEVANLLGQLNEVWQQIGQQQTTPTVSKVASIG
jgi:flagellar protein FliS